MITFGGTDPEHYHEPVAWIPLSSQLYWQISMDRYSLGLLQNATKSARRNISEACWTVLPLQYYHQWQSCWLRRRLPGYRRHGHVLNHWPDVERAPNNPRRGSQRRGRRGKRQKDAMSDHEIPRVHVHQNDITSSMFSQLVISCDFELMPNVTFHIQGQEFPLPPSAYTIQVFRFLIPCQVLCLTYQMFQTPVSHPAVSVLRLPPRLRSNL